MTAPATTAHLTAEEQRYYAALAETERVLAEAQDAVGDEAVLVMRWLAFQLAKMRVGAKEGQG